MFPKLIRGSVIGLFLVGALVVILNGRGYRGFHLKVIMSGSMDPAIKTGSLVVIQSVPSAAYVVGDIVSFHPAVRNPPDITHRITRLFSTTTGARVMATKGDANANGDPWVTSVGAIQGREIFTVPWIGYGVLFMKTPYGFVGFIVISFMILVWPELQFLRDCTNRCWQWVRLKSVYTAKR